MFKFFLKPVVLCLVSEALAPAASAPSPTPGPVPPQALFFELDQVRLMDGPFKVAQETDEAYLLKLDPDRFLSWFRREAGLTQEAAGKLLGWSADNVSSAERSWDGSRHVQARMELTMWRTLLADADWLDDATKTIGQFWRLKNARRNGLITKELSEAALVVSLVPSKNP